MGEAGPDHQLRRSHSDQDLWTRQQQLDRAAEFYTAVGPDGECRNKSRYFYRMWRKILDAFTERVAKGLLQKVKQC